MIEANDFLSALGVGGAAKSEASTGSALTQQAAEASQANAAADNGEVLQAFADFLTHGTFAEGFEESIAAVAKGDFPALMPATHQALTPGLIHPTIEQQEAHFDLYEAARYEALGKLDPGLSVLGASATPLHSLDIFTGDAPLTAAFQPLEAGAAGQLLAAAQEAGVAPDALADRLTLAASVTGPAGTVSGSPLAPAFNSPAALDDLKAQGQAGIGSFGPLQDPGSVVAGLDPQAMVTDEAAVDALTGVQAQNSGQAGAVTPGTATNNSAQPRLTGDVVMQNSAVPSGYDGSKNTGFQAGVGGDQAGLAAAKAGDVLDTATNQAALASLQGEAHGTGVQARDKDARPRARDPLASTGNQSAEAESAKQQSLPDLTPRDGRGLPHWVLPGTGAATLEGLAGLGTPMSYSGGAAFGLVGAATPGSPFAPFGEPGAHLAASDTGARTVGASPAQAVSQVNLAIGRAQSQGLNAFTIKLDPGELGRLSVQLRFAVDGSASAEIAAANPETLRMLQSEARSIEKALTAGGHSLSEDGITFTLEDHGGQSAGRAFQEARQEAMREENLNQLSSDGGNGAPGLSLEEQLMAMGDGDSIDVEAIVGRVTPETGLDIRI